MRFLIEQLLRSNFRFGRMYLQPAASAGAIRSGRCPACRAKRRAANGGNTRGDRQMYEVICDGCGQPTQVPFQPRGDRPVYCRACFEQQRNRY